MYMYYRGEIYPEKSVISVLTVREMIGFGIL